MKELTPQIVEVLKYQPGRYVVERHIIHQYICKECMEENMEAEIVIAPGAPKRLIKGSYASSSVVAWIAFNKYVSGVPLCHHEQVLKRKKVPVSRANMSNWLMRSCDDKLSHLYQYMCDDIKTFDHIHTDEKTVVVLEDKKNSERQKSYMLMLMSGKWEEKQIALYSITKVESTNLRKES